MAVIDVRAHGAKGDGDANKASADDTVAIDAAMSSAKQGDTVYFPPGVYVIDGARVKPDIGPPHGLWVESGVTFSGSGAASVLRLKTGSTGTKDTPLDPQMFYRGPRGELANVTFEHLTFDGNALGNPVHGTVDPGLEQCGKGWDGTTGGDTGVGHAVRCCAIQIGGEDTFGVQVTNLVVRDCTFRDFPGASVILLHDRRDDVTEPFSRDVTITGNTFVNNRYAPVRENDVNRDHSTVNVFADNAHVDKNRFVLPTTATRAQRQLMAACELHGSFSTFNGNTLERYGMGAVFSENLRHKATAQEAVGNVMREHGYRAFYVDAGGFNSLGDINIANNSVAFGEVVAQANAHLSAAYGSTWLPFPKWESPDVSVGRVS